MRFKPILAVGIFLAALILAGCGDKSIDPQNISQDGNRIARPGITSIIGEFTVTGARCFFITDSTNNITYELVFTNVRPPNFISGSSVTANGYLSAGDVTDNRCGFVGPQIVVQSIYANNVGSADQNTNVNQQ